MHLDTRTMSGAAIGARVAPDGRFTLVGRAYLHGLKAGGREGVDRAIGILDEHVARTMRRLGVSALQSSSRAT